MSEISTIFQTYLENFEGAFAGLQETKIEETDQTKIKKDENEENNEKTFKENIFNKCSHIFHFIKYN